MGQILVKTTEGMEGTITNYEKSGDTYLVLYKQLPLGTDLSQRKRSHMALVVDVEGKSTASLLCGEQLRMYYKPQFQFPLAHALIYVI